MQTIGHGTGISTLAIGSFLAFGAIIGGVAAVVKCQEWRFEPAGRRRQGQPA